MKNTLITLSLLFTSLVSFSQIYTFDFYAHNSYTNGNPGQIVVLNDNWQDNIEYTGSGDGYHVRYVIDAQNWTFETFIIDYGGESVIGKEYTLEYVVVLESLDKYLHVYNPVSEKTSLFYFNKEGIPYFIVEDSNGKGKFSGDDDFTYQID
jgi:hypothetical protein